MEPSMPGNARECHGLGETTPPVTTGARPLPAGFCPGRQLDSLPGQCGSARPGSRTIASVRATVRLPLPLRMVAPTSKSNAWTRRKTECGR